MKKIFVYILMIIGVGFPILSSFLQKSPSVCYADEVAFSQSFAMPPNEHFLEISGTYTNQKELSGTLNIELSVETNKETIKKYQKFSQRQRIDTGDIGELFYTDITYTSNDSSNQLNELGGKFYFVVTVNKNLKHKNLVVIPFTDEITTGSIIQPTETTNENGQRCISFYGSKNYTAYAVVYNGIYKDLILMGIILFVILVVCIYVKIYCLRKDHPEYLEKLKAKAVAKKKEENKYNKKMAQALKREKEKQKKLNM